MMLPHIESNMLVSLPKHSLTQLHTCFKRVCAHFSASLAFKMFYTVSRKKYVTYLTSFYIICYIHELHATQSLIFSIVSFDKVFMHI